VVISFSRYGGKLLLNTECAGTAQVPRADRKKTIRNKTIASLFLPQRHEKGKPIFPPEKNGQMVDRFGIIDAMGFAAIQHANQVRRYTKEPYIAHCMRVAEKLLSLEAHFPVTDEMLMAAVLHDVVEDTDCTEQDIRTRFGATVAGYVSALSLDPMARNRRERYKAYAAQLRAAPVEVQRIKICDLWDNILDIEEHDPSFFRVYQREALMIADSLDKLGAEISGRLKSLLLNPAGASRSGAGENPFG
jgi:(p)ppGpp synthase/HD superfamily hydrolase